MFYKSERSIVKIYKEHILIISILLCLATSCVLALFLINLNSNILLSDSNKITAVALNYNGKKSEIYFNLTALLAITAIILLILFLISAYRNLFAPICQIYKEMPNSIANGLDEVNILSMDLKACPVYSEVKEVFNKFNGLITIIEDLNKNIPFKYVLKHIFNSFNEYIPFTYIGVALLDENKETLTETYGITNNYHKNLSGKLLGYKENVSNTGLGKVLDSGEERVINDLEAYLVGKPNKLYNEILLEEGVKSSITFPLKSDNKTFGIIFFSSNTKNVYKKEHIKFIKTLVNSIALSLEKEILINNMTIGSTLSLATLTEERDPETGQHLTRIQTYCRVIAEILSKKDKYKNVIDIDYINNIERFSPLHDIGKVAIRDEILLKPGKLTPEEFDVMKTHTTYGSSVLKLAEENVKKNGRRIFEMAIEIAEGHHEKWDGSGYPYGKKQEQIPLSARIVAVADVFDALTSKRPYKNAFSFKDSIKIINDGSGSHFDPDIIDLLNENIDKIKEIYYRCQSLTDY
jgi:HD-GYP domain-containing protein (c-di-GMP phosphodiesterase class II)